MVHIYVQLCKIGKRMKNLGTLAVLKRSEASIGIISVIL